MTSLKIWPLKDEEAQSYGPIEMYAHEEDVWEIYLHHVTYHTHGPEFTAKFVSNHATLPVIIEKQCQKIVFDESMALYKYLMNVMKFK